MNEDYEELRRIAPDLAPSIAKLPMPAYILDRSGAVRWLNAAAVRHFGDLRGRRVGQIVEREYATLARQEFAAKMLGTVHASEGTIAVRTIDGRRVSVDISSTQLIENGSIVGVFGLADPSEEDTAPRSNTSQLTPRQHEVLRHIAKGRTTGQIAQELGISVDTVRNHIRHVMGRLRVHTRLEAVIRGHELGLV